MRNSFHARFIKSTFVSHFTPIPVKRETKGHFRSLLPVTDPGKRVKPCSAKIQAPVSPQTALVSRHFTFRFTIPLASANGRRPTAGKLCSSVLAIVSAEGKRYFSGSADSRLLFLAEFLKSGIGSQRVPTRIEP